MPRIKRFLLKNKHNLLYERKSALNKNRLGCDIIIVDDGRAFYFSKDGNAKAVSPSRIEVRYACADKLRCLSRKKNMRRA